MIDAVVTGTSLPALQTALDLAEVGMSVSVIAAPEAEPLKPWAERDPAGVIAAFLTRIAEPIGHTDHDRSEAESAAESPAFPVFLPPGPVMLRRSTEWLPEADPSVLGIPAVPLAKETIALLGGGPASRAFVDRFTPLLTVGKTKMLGDLVRKRMGAKLRDRLVDPQVHERYGVGSDEVEVAVAAPGLNEALSRAGALSSAVLAYSERNVARETRVAPAGGTEQLQRALVHRLENYGVTLVPGPVESVGEVEGGWTVVLAGGETIAARALIADAGEKPETEPAMRQLLATVLPREARMYADIDMSDSGQPSWLPEGATAVDRHGDWTLRLEAGHSIAPVKESSGTVLEPGLSITSAVGTVAELAEQLAHHNGPEASVLEAWADWIPNVPEREIGLVAAPFRTISAKHGAEAAIDALTEQHPTLLPVGRALHGDDQSAALDHAHQSAVRLRRHLLGLDAD